MGPVETAINTFRTYAPTLIADLAIVPTDIYIDPRWYRSGKAYGPGYAQIEFNPDHPRFETDWDTECGALVLHELHHCLRWKHVGPRWTVGEVVVLEGLAMLAESTSGFRPMDYGDAPPASVLSNLCKKAYLARSESESAEPAWFRSTEILGVDLDAPVNYHLSKKMMREATRALGLNPFQAAGVSCETLLHAWKSAQPTPF
ncbi:MAG: DUF2268 domain-containing putative Zn-dependent protease [Pseudomonadota bacterium]